VILARLFKAGLCSIAAAAAEEVLLDLLLKDHKRRPRGKPSLRDEENDKALNCRASLKSRSAAEESILKIPDKVTEP
jgi:hypothetical protein